MAIGVGLALFRYVLLVRQSASDRVFCHILIVVHAVCVAVPKLVDRVQVVFQCLVNVIQPHWSTVAMCVIILELAT
jgi:hypothetical protein